MYAPLLRAIKAHILAPEPDGTPSPFLHVDLYQRQVQRDMLGQSAAYNKPAVFVSFESVQWDTAFDGSQMAERMVIAFYLVQNSKASNAAGNPTEVLADALLANIHRLHLRLQGFFWTDNELFYQDPDVNPELSDGAGIGPLKRVREDVDDSFTTLVSHKLTYVCTATDHSTRHHSGERYTTEPVAANPTTETLGWS